MSHFAATVASDLNTRASNNLPRLVVILMLCAASGVRGQTNSCGLLSAKYDSRTGKIDFKPTGSRLYVIGSTNSAKPPVLRLLVADQPFLSEKWDCLRCGTNAMGEFACEVSLGTNRFPRTEYAQLVDVPLNTPQGRGLLDVIIGQTNRVWLQIGSADNGGDFKAYVVPVPAILELKKEAKAAKGIKPAP